MTEIKLGTEALISIIMPAHNAGKTVAEAVRSVLAQSYPYWELIITDDGSTDDTNEIILSFSHPGIKCLRQEHKGVSAARNLALDNMNGEYFCFLDADDVLPVNSLKSRYEVFRKEGSLNFVDGLVQIRDSALNKILYLYKPGFKGNPLQELLSLRRTCFFGNTWMIKRIAGTAYRFEEGLTHAEDLIFYLSIAGTGNYSYTNECILWCRRNTNSAMSDLQGLEKGYSHLLKYVNDNIKPGRHAYRRLKLKARSILFKSYLKKGKVLQAFLSLKL